VNNVKRVLSLDISSKTGWGFFKVSTSNIRLIECGRLPKTNLDANLPYPEDYLQWASYTWQEMESLLDRFNPTHIAVEETTIKVTGSNNFSQKFLEWCHYHLATYLVNNPLLDYRYFKTDEWRKVVGCNTMTDADKKHNKLYRETKKAMPDEYKTDSDGEYILKKKKKILKPKIVKDSTGKRISLVDKKDLNIRKANELFGLNLIKKDEDIADGALLGYALSLQIQ